MKKLLALFAVFGLCLFAITPTFANNGASSATMDNNTVLTMMTTTTAATIEAKGNMAIDGNATTVALDEATITPTDTDNHKLATMPLPVDAVTLMNEKNRLFLASTPGLPSQVDFNNNLTAIENRVLNPGGQNPAFGNNGDSKMKMLMLSSCENFGQALEEKAAVVNDEAGKLLAFASTGTPNVDEKGNTMILTGSAATLVVATFDGAQRAKIPKAAPSNHEGIFGFTSIAS